MNKRSITGRITNSFAWYLGLLKKRDRGSGRKGVLIIRTDLIGDFVLFSPALNYLRKRYSGMNISLVVQSVVNDIAEENQFVDDVIIIDKKKYCLNPFYRIHFLRQIRKRRFKIAINTVYSRDIISDEITLWSDAEERIGWGTNMPNMYLNEKNKGDKTYTKLLPNKNINANSHELNINMELVKSLGMEIDDFIPKILINEEQTSVSKEVFAGIDNKKSNLIGFLTEANDSFREWPFSKYCELADRICNEFSNSYIVLFGTDNRNIMQIKENKRILDLRGKTRINELPALLSVCKLVVGNETGPIHIACAVGVPSVCILGGGHFNRFVPYPSESGLHNMIAPVFHEMDCFMCGWNCIHNDNNTMPYPCINNITVDDVFNIVKNKISKLNMIKE